MIVNAIPACLRQAISVGIGLFIAFIGLKNAGIVVSDPVTFLALGRFTPSVVLAMTGIVLGGVLLARRVKGALCLRDIGLFTLIGIPLGITRIPENFSPVSLPHSLKLRVCFKFDFHALSDPDMLIAIVASLILMDIFDTLGTLVGTANKVGMVEPTTEKFPV